MPLLFCPECGHEISQNAVACPNCGRPLQTTPPVVEKKVVVPPPVQRRDQFPPWVWVPIGAAGLLLLLVLYLLMRNPNEDANVNVAVNARRTNSATTTTTSVPSTDTQTVTVPGSETTVPSTTTSAPVAPAPTTGTVIINARILPPRASAPTPARSTKFYLLDKDVDSVLDDAGVEPIEGNDLAGSLGLASVFPDRYGAFQRAAMRAIAAKAKYTVTTNASGNADLANIAPDQYYLFAVQRVGNGFVLWNSPVSVIAGQNVLNLSPQNVTEVTDTSG